MYFPLCCEGKEHMREEIQLFQSTSALCPAGAREGGGQTRKGRFRKRVWGVGEGRGEERKATNGKEKLFICAQMLFKDLFSWSKSK